MFSDRAKHVIKSHFNPFQLLAAPLRQPELIGRELAEQIAADN